MLLEKAGYRVEHAPNAAWLAALLAVMLGACATQPDLVPGQSTEADVMAAMGPPTESRALADGDRLLWYARPVPGAAYGSERLAVTLAPDGKLRSVEQRLVPQYIAKVTPGQSKASEVRDLIGPPGRAYARAGKSSEVWEYELEGFQRPLTLYIEFSPEQVVQAVYTLERSGEAF
jgi:hypothetical protein